MATLADIREALRAQLDTIPGLQASAYQLGNPTPPAAEITVGPTEYDLALGRGLDRVTLLARVYVAPTTDVGGQKLLDRLLAPTGAESVKTVLETDPTLGGIVDDVHVLRHGGYMTFVQDGRAAYLGTEFTVEILTSN